jgi:hypothetical protein
MGVERAYDVISYLELIDTVPDCNDFPSAIGQRNAAVRGRQFPVNHEQVVEVQ